MNDTHTDPAFDSSALGGTEQESDEAWAKKRGHKTRERRCLASGDVTDTGDMVRFVLSPDDIVTPDIMGKLPGRGVWVSAHKDALTSVIKSKGFARGFKGKAILPENLEGFVEDLLAKRLLGLITMARKSGQIHIGYDQVKSAASAGELAWRIEAKDGSEDGRSKIRTLSKAIAKELELPVPMAMGCFTNAELSAALSRDSVVHIGLPRGPMAKAFKRDALRLDGFKPLVPPDWPDIAHERQYAQ